MISPSFIDSKSLVHPKRKTTTRTHIRTAPSKDQPQHCTHCQPLRNCLNKNAPRHRQHFGRRTSFIINPIHFGLFQRRCSIDDLRSYDIALGIRGLQFSKRGAASWGAHWSWLRVAGGIGIGSASSRHSWMVGIALGWAAGLVLVDVGCGMDERPFFLTRRLSGGVCGRGKRDSRGDIFEEWKLGFLDVPDF